MVSARLAKVKIRMMAALTRWVFHFSTHNRIRVNKIIQMISRGNFTAYPFEAEARVIIFKNSVRTSKKTQHFSMTKIN
jgi:hypothetical protein